MLEEVFVDTWDCIGKLAIMSRRETQRFSKRNSAQPKSLSLIWTLPTRGCAGGFFKSAAENRLSNAVYGSTVPIPSHQIFLGSHGSVNLQTPHSLGAEWFTINIAELLAAIVVLGWIAFASIKSNVEIYNDSEYARQMIELQACILMQACLPRHCRNLRASSGVYNLRRYRKA